MGISRAIKELGRLFYRFSGLCINIGKSSIQMEGVILDHANHMAEISGLQMSLDSSSYLGIPFSSTKITTSQCLSLYDKITRSMNIWSNRLLSQAGCLVLINSVIFSYSSYWCRTFLLPKKLILMIKKAVRNFFMDW